MTKREKRIQRMRQNPTKVLYNDFVRLLEDFGFEVVNAKGSHRKAKLQVNEETYRLVFAEPHGKNKYVHPKAIQAVLQIIDEIKKAQEDEDGNPEDE